MGTNKYVKMLLISICLEINEISLLWCILIFMDFILEKIRKIIYFKKHNILCKYTFGLVVN